MSHRTILALCWLGLVSMLFSSSGFSAEPESFDVLGKQFDQQTRPLLATFCLGCHSTEKLEGELDLERFASIAELRKDPRVWQKVIEMLDNGEMPPEKAKQPTAEQRKQVREWAQRYLHAEARANAGDPGRVVLRRLSNVEYDLTVRDLTGVDLRPARQFPGDGAAGEGFTNAGEALVMSPALIQKYFDAAKGIADHAVLLPDGFRFSEATTRRDWTNDILGQIRQIYREYTDPAGSRRVNLQGLNFEAESGGRIPLEAYLTAATTHRDALNAGTKTIAAVASENHLSAKYLQTLWDLLNGQKPSPLFDPLRARWKTARPDDIAGLAAEIRQWQDALTKFNSVAHFKTWQESINPLVETRPFRIKLTPSAEATEVVLRLVTRDAGDGHEHDFVEWRQPRLESPNRPLLLLRDLRAGWRAVAVKRQTFGEAAKYLAVVDEARGRETAVDIGALAKERQLDAVMLQAWFNYLGVGPATLKIETLFTERIESSGGYAFVQGWGLPATPSVVANSSDQQVRIPGIMKPHSVAVHPAPEQNVAAGWRSPMTGHVRVEARVIHAHPECGNGLAWFIQLRRGGERRQLAGGEVDRGQAAKIEPIDNLAVQTGDLVSLLIGPRASDHTCDLTEVELQITEVGDGTRVWSLARDTSKDLLAGNPHADLLGNREVWYFYREPVEAGGALAGVPRGSLLDRWRDEPSRTERGKLADELQRLLVAGPPADKSQPDAVLYQQLTSASGPLLGALDFSRLAAEATSPTDEQELQSQNDQFGLPLKHFGNHPLGNTVDRANLVVQAPAILEIRLPAALAVGREFVVEATLERQAGATGSVQVEVLVDQAPATANLIAGQPVVVQDPAIRSRFEKSFDEFRRVLPAAVCYPKIVPVDEVVTLVQFHRDDERLSRLMLEEAEQQRLERLWDELRYISQDALKVQEAYGQFMEYVTQDGDVRLFEPLRKPIAERAAAFRQRLVDTEPRHLDRLLDFAARAYRRPLSPQEQIGLRDLYAGLRSSEIEHEAAFRLTLARILVSPAFLYRVEQPAAGDTAQPVSDWELANRLSYFLWSSMPDEELRQVAAAGQLRNPEVLVQQTKRLLSSGQVRSLATEFACQWLDVRNFDTFDEKNEKLYPEFAELRDDMYEETVRFFVDLFQHDGSVLAILDADYSILSPTLAKHYGIPFPATGNNAEWRRVDGLKQHGRGGILGMATTLAKHSGASRTSPVLRGNWVSEFLLGEKLPKPPKNVPQLPEAENATDLTVRQLVEKHRAVAACAKCHDRIDPLGFALEGFDTVGRARDKDLAGRAIDTKVAFTDGVTFDGLNGLRDYLLNQRRDQFVRQFCRKLLGYALGRGVQISDEPLLEEMSQRLRETDYRFATAVEVIVNSQQFRYQRGRGTGRGDVE